MKSFLKLLAIGVVANFNAQLIPSAQQMRQQEQAFYNNATVLVKQQINPQTGVPYLSTGINLSMVDSFANLYQFNDVDYNTADADLFLQAMSELHNASAESQFLSASELEAKETHKYHCKILVPVLPCKIRYRLVSSTPISIFCFTMPKTRATVG